jgi:hypothetical protein
LEIVDVEVEVEDGDEELTGGERGKKNLTEPKERSRQVEMRGVQRCSANSVCMHEAPDRCTHSSRDGGADGMYRTIQCTRRVIIIIIRRI